jgi:hypothetical protein
MSWCYEMIAMLLLLSLLHRVVLDKIVAERLTIFIIKVVSIA